MKGDRWFIERWALRILLVIVAVCFVAALIASTCRAESVRPCDTTYGCPDGFSYNGVNCRRETGAPGFEIAPPKMVIRYSASALDSLRSEVARLTKTLDSLVNVAGIRQHYFAAWKDSIYDAKIRPDSTTIKLRLLIEWLDGKFIEVGAFSVPALPAELRGK